MLTRRVFISGLASASFSACKCEDDHSAKVEADAPYLRRIDVHLHIGSRGYSEAANIMREEGIAGGVNLSGGAVGHGLEAQLNRASAFGGRLVTFTSPRWAECEREGYGERLAAQLDEAVNLGARGLKIHKALGLSVLDARGKLVSVAEPELDAMFAAAGKHSIPVWIHTGDPLAFWSRPDASNERRAELEAHPDWSLYGKAVPTFDELYAQLEHRVARHPSTQFVSVHFGNCAEQPERVAATLRKYSNLWIDTAARIPELGRHPVEAMRTFFTEFQDRILFGSDLGIGPHPKPLFLGSSGSTPPTPADRRRFFDATRRYFETADEDFDHPTPIQGEWKISGLALPAPILEKVYVTNAQRLLGLPR